MEFNAKECGTRIKNLRTANGLKQIELCDKMRILKYLGKISKDQMSAVEHAALESLGMPIPECVDAP